MVVVPLLLLLALAAPAVAAPGEVSQTGAPVRLVLFHGEGCPHCAAEREWLTGLAERHPALVLELHEVWYDEGNRALLQRTADAMGFEPSGVPVTVVGDRVWVGFSDSVAEEIEAAVVAATTGSAPAGGNGDAATVATVDVPFIGAMDLGGSSLLAATLAIGFVDGVNPCSLWVLSVLLAVVLHGGSRARVALVGTTFLAVTAAMYALYVTGLYTALDFVGSMWLIRVAVAAVAIGFGVLQLKDAVAPGHGPSLSIAAPRRPGLIRRMRAVAAPDRGLGAVLGGTVVLAVGVSLLETPCTAGLPMLWTTMLAEQDVSRPAAIGLFAVYLLVFLLDELVVFGAAVFALRATRLQEHHGAALKLVAGSVLVVLGLTMLLAPAAMSSLVGTLLVFGAAAGVALVVWFGVRPRVRVRQG